MNSLSFDKPARPFFFSIFEINLELERRAECTKTKTYQINSYEADLPVESLEDDPNGSFFAAKAILHQSCYLPNNFIFGLTTAQLEPSRLQLQTRLLGFKQNQEVHFCGTIHEMRICQGAHESVWGQRLRLKNQIIELTIVKNMLTGTVRFRITVETPKVFGFMLLQKIMARATLQTMQHLVQTAKKPQFSFSQTSA